ncbi:sporulation YhaL family protein [Peribacillus glennii]|uniref:SigE-dependent sporulation protein n=1 Tax=Peribacillus glennii TaxID=2303991 RepID=A0A372L994_9BACI|nr:sporulation YhaL family protein [Peribacillus glennii]RFU62110.1 SigE-dependent sporulation protein [Peribacillus glennii]
MPIWIWLVLAGIIVSAVMTVRTAKQERKEDELYIEQEGQKYIDRMNEEKEKKKSGVQPGT